MGLLFQEVDSLFFDACPPAHPSLTSQTPMRACNFREQPGFWKVKVRCVHKALVELEIGNRKARAVTTVGRQSECPSGRVQSPLKFNGLFRVSI